MGCLLRITSVVAAVLILAGCSFVPDDECRPNVGVCDGNTARVCVSKDYGENSSYYAWSERECGAYAQCQVVKNGALALCAYGPTRPTCEQGDGFVCDGTELLGCNSGYVVSWQHCVSCATNGAECTEFGWDAMDCCQGKMDDTCEQDEDCVEGLFCVSHPGSQWFKTCSLLCDCPDGLCPACENMTSSRRAYCYRGVCRPE